MNPAGLYAPPGSLVSFFIHQMKKCFHMFVITNFTINHFGAVSTNTADG